MLRDYGAGERTRQRYLRPGNGGYDFFLSSSVSGHENFPKRRRFLELLHANGRSTALLSHPGLSRAGSGSRKKKNGSRTEGCDDVVTRLDPIATHMARWNLE